MKNSPDRRFQNCPRYFHRMQRLDAPCLPQTGHTPTLPAPMRVEIFRDETERPNSGGRA
jgi:hypothetical protein